MKELIAAFVICAAFGGFAGTRFADWKKGLSKPVYDADPRLEKVCCEKRWLQRWYEMFEAFDPAAPQPYGSVVGVAAKREPNGYHWGGCPSGQPDGNPSGGFPAALSAIG